MQARALAAMSSKSESLRRMEHPNNGIFNPKVAPDPTLQQRLEEKFKEAQAGLQQPKRILSSVPTLSGKTSSRV